MAYGRFKTELLATGVVLSYMWSKLSLFGALLVIILGLEYAFFEKPVAFYFVPTSWARFFAAAFLAGGLTWFWSRLRSARPNRSARSCGVRMGFLAKLGRVSLLVPLALQGCGEKGHVRISEKEVPGTYLASFETGKEQLILRSDNTYEQIFSSPTKKFTNRGKWEAKYLLLEGTDIGLIHANCSEDEDHPSQGPPVCYRNLNVHREGGKLKAGAEGGGGFLLRARRLITAPGTSTRWIAAPYRNHVGTALAIARNVCSLPNSTQKVSREGGLVRSIRGGPRIHF